MIVAALGREFDGHSDFARFGRSKVVVEPCPVALTNERGRFRIVDLPADGKLAVRVPRLVRVVDVPNPGRYDAGRGFDFEGRALKGCRHRRVSCTTRQDTGRVPDRASALRRRCHPRGVLVVTR